MTCHLIIHDDLLPHGVDAEDVAMAIEVKAIPDPRVEQLQHERDAAVKREADTKREVSELERFHPRAMKLLKKRKNFVVVADDEPYFLQVYALIRSHQMERGTWSDQDERIFQDCKAKAFPFYNPPEPVDIGRRIKAERKTRRITQREVCEQIGMRFSRLGGIESGLSDPPTDDELRGIASALGMTVEQLRGGEG